MDKGKLVELAERCEAASAPDRELDGEIARQCSGHEVQRVSVGPGYRREDWVFIDRNGAAPTSRPVPRYTASIDAALSLLPSGFDHYGFDRNLTGDVLSLSHVTTQAFVDGGASDFSQYHRAEAATPALAFCAAALRAAAAVA